MMDKNALLGSAGSTTSGGGVLIDGGLYVFSYTCATWNSASGQLSVLGPDKSTYINIGSAFTANGMQGPFAIGGASTCKVTISGTPSAAVFASLDRYQGAP